MAGGDLIHWLGAVHGAELEALMMCGSSPEFLESACVSGKLCFTLI